MEYREPEIGETIYIPTGIHMSRGKDDVSGGKATIKEIFIDENTNEYNKVMITVNEVAGHKYNWRYVLSNQEQWKERYKHSTARNMPDNRAEFNKW